MKVRIVKVPGFADYWDIETWVWYRPWWRYVTGVRGYAEALKHALLVKNPLIVKIT